MIAEESMEESLNSQAACIAYGIFHWSGIFSQSKDFCELVVSSLDNCFRSNLGSDGVLADWLVFFKKWEELMGQN